MEYRKEGVPIGVSSIKYDVLFPELVVSIVSRVTPILVSGVSVVSDVSVVSEVFVVSDVLVHEHARIAMLRNTNIVMGFLIVVSSR